MKRIVFLLSIMAAIIIFSGCSVYMAAKQPDKKNLDVLTKGMPRSAVLAELGQPVSTEVKSGQKCDVFKFVQGYSSGAKVGRAVWHATADVLTLGLWEIVGTPTEAVFSGDDKVIEVTYNKDDRVESCRELLSGLKEGSKPETPKEAVKSNETNPEMKAEIKPDTEAQPLSEAKQETNAESNSEPAVSSITGQEPKTKSEPDKEIRQASITEAKRGTGKAKLNITRNNDALFMGVQARVDINGKRVAELWRDESYTGEVEIGTTTILTDAWSTPGRFLGHFDAEADKEYIFEIRPRSEHWMSLIAVGGIGAAIHAGVDENTGPFSIRLKEIKSFQ